MSLFVRKPMAALMNEAAETGTHTLKRTLGAGGLIALGIGAIIGAGLFSIQVWQLQIMLDLLLLFHLLLQVWVVFLQVYVMQNLHP